MVESLSLAHDAQWAAGNGTTIVQTCPQVTYRKYGSGIERFPNGVCPRAFFDRSSTAVAPSTSLRQDSNWQLP